MNVDIYKEEGPILVLAGPGTGKTYCLGQRIKFLVEDKSISPNNIGVITFTGAAAKNMRDRISDESEGALYLSYKNQPKLICTMHSLGYKIIRENAGYFGLKEDVNVLPDILQKIMLEDAAQIAGFSRDSAKETLRCRQFGECIQVDEVKCKICEKYLAILQACSAVDYDGQILLACNLLKSEPEILDKYRQQCKNLLVDEYQDINSAQFKMISLLSEENRDGLFVVGDDDQSIYSWRGGSPKFIRNFRKYFGKDAKIRTLQKSYRCHKSILESAFSVVKRFDKNRIEKGKFNYRTEDGMKVQIHNTASDEKEARLIRIVLERVLPSKDVLILYPNKYFAKAIKTELRNAKIPFSAPSEPPAEGLPLISYLSAWLKQKTDSLSFRICMESLSKNPQLKIPSKGSRKPEKLAEREAAFKILSNLWIHIINNDTDNLWDSLVLEKDNVPLYSFYFDAFNRLCDLYENGNGLPSFISHVTSSFIPWNKIHDFLQEVDFWIATSDHPNTVGHKVRLMSLQGAKGLEANIVCVIGLEEGTLPKDLVNLREQSRLMFVSMTRAKTELHLFHARKRSGNIVHRNIFNKGKLPDMQPSRFLDCLPTEHKENKYHPA